MTFKMFSLKKSDLETIVKNKYYKFFKYLLGAALVLSSTIALVASWYVGTQDSATQTVVKTTLAKNCKIPLLILGFLSLVITIVLLATQKNAILSVSMLALTVTMIIILLTLAGLTIDQTWFHAVPAPPAKP